MQCKFSKDEIYSAMPSMNESFKTDLPGHFTCQINGFSFWYLRPEEDSEIHAVSDYKKRSYKKQR